MVEESRCFGKISEMYDRARPSYPIQLINDIIHYSGKPQGVVLDVGCGTGQATPLFAERSYQITALDVDTSMIDIAKKKYSNFPKVNFKVSTFEDANIPPESIDIIVSGMAWHWIKPVGLGEEKAAYFLRNNGTLALFWSYQLKEKSDFVMSVAEILDKYGEKNRGPTGSKVKLISHEVLERLKGNNSFSSIEFREYEEQISYTKERYHELIISYGWVQCLTEQQQKSVTKELQDLFEKYDSTLNIPHKYLLVLAKKRQSPR